MDNLTETDVRYKFLKPPAADLDSLGMLLGAPSTGVSADLDLQIAGSGRPVTGRVTNANLFSHQEAHPIVLDMAMLAKYGPEWLGWESETIEYRVPQDFRTNISTLNLSKLQAMRTLHMVDSFWQRWEIFCWCCMPLNGIFPDFETMQVPSVSQCMVAVDIANRARDDMQWSEEVKAYLSAVHRHDEVLVPQEPLSFIKVETAGFPIDVQSILKMWPDTRTGKYSPPNDTVEGMQLRRMLNAHEVLESSRSQLRLQLKEVLNA